MIVVDCSALFAVLLGEDEHAHCRTVLGGDERLMISGGSLAEVLVVAAGKHVLEGMQQLLDGLGMTVIPLTEDRAYAAAAAYRRWGKGHDPARLNICDCFAYALAAEHDCPLLFVGDDFARTDIRAAI